MSRPPISHVELTPTLVLSECHPTADYRGPWWLYDKTRGMNLAMGAPTEHHAFVRALTYYQERLSKVEEELAQLKSRVNDFVQPFIDAHMEEEELYDG